MHGFYLAHLSSLQNETVNLWIMLNKVKSLNIFSLVCIFRVRKVKLCIFNENLKKNLHTRLIHTLSKLCVYLTNTLKDLKIRVSQ
jgi:hypothetical protein